MTLTPVIARALFTSIQHLGNGDVILHGTATPNASVKIDGSEDLVNWQLLGAIDADGQGQFTFTDNPGVLTKRFYRAFTQ